MNDWKRGLKKGIPIALGYLSVSFTFGVKAAHGGLPVWVAVLISLTNVTSAGQLAGLELMLTGGTYVEIALSTFIINMRYMLMSLSLTQKIKPGTKKRSQAVFGFAITDEIFAVAATEPGEITASFMYGLISIPIFGWVLGTFLGAAASHIMPASLGNAMELGLYAMFIAIIIPPSKKGRSVFFVVVMAAAVSALLYYVPLFSFISGGFRVILATVLVSVVAAAFMPVRREEEHD